MKSLLLSLLAAATSTTILIIPSIVVVVSALPSYLEQNSHTPGTNQVVRRERNLDHWDADTLAYYLDNSSSSSDFYPGFDVAVMFYARWDSNSKSLAPYWDRIATTLDAGNERSRLVMALFDCELNIAHSELCHAAGITHYPTLLFMGSGPYHDSDPITKTVFGTQRSVGIMGEAPVRNTVKFQGNWNYVDSITDWIRTMQALSNWHLWSTQGWGKRFRLFSPSKNPNAPLPVGIPRITGSTSTSSTRSRQSSLSEGSSRENNNDSLLRVQSLEAQVEQLTGLTQTYKKAMGRWSTFLDAVLINDATTNTTDSDSAGERDMFALLLQQNAWKVVAADTAGAASSVSGNVNDDGNVNQTQVLWSCVIELSLDYCQRISPKAAEALAGDLFQQGLSVDEILALPDLDQKIRDRLGGIEPYCATLDHCIETDFAGVDCQPPTCPFRNPVACQFLTACLDPALQQEYAEALGVSLPTETTTTTSSTTTSSSSSSEKDGVKKKTWGF